MKSWSEKYRLGYSEIDKDHEVLFEIIDKGMEISKNKLSIDKFDKIMGLVEELREYSIYHFKKEEEIMLREGYNKFFSHKVEHMSFIDKIESIDIKEIERDGEKYVNKVIEFGLNWLGSHILNKDMEFIEYYNKKVENEV
ncbi:MAG: bacteriohemerythrin [Clostridium sp.]|uniref:bacteriohemerythrin n=1 Tax=Clostridium sp. TaxID=1506 RepID=UPI003F3D58F0